MTSGAEEVLILPPKSLSGGTFASVRPSTTMTVVMVGYGTGVLVGAVLGVVTFFAWLVGYWLWDGLQWGDLVKSVIAAAVFMAIWLVLFVRLNRRRG